MNFESLPLILAPLLAFGLWMAVRLWFGARGMGWRQRFPYIFRILQVLFFLLLLAAILFGSAASIFGVVIALLAAVTLVEAVVERRAARRRTTCTLLALSVERGQQIAPSTLAAGLPDNDTVGRASTDLFGLLDSGVPLAEAIRRCPKALPREAVAYVAAGESAAAEVAALKELRQGEQTNLTAVWRSYLDRLCYLAAVLVMLSLIMTFLMIKIIPEFEKIFVEFDVELPQMTLLAVSLSQFTVNYLAAPVFLLMVGGTLVALLVGIFYLCDLPVLRWLGDRLFRGRRTADVLRILAVSTEHRQPLSTVIQRLANVYPSRMLRRQLAPVAATVGAGDEWCQALRKARVVNANEQSLLQTAERAGNLPWALRTIAARQEQRIVYRLAAAVQVLYPVVILLLGALVGFFVIAMFIPLVKLVEALC
jgi:type II secretory pathway component PulF